MTSRCLIAVWRAAASALPMIIGGILPAVLLLRLFPGHANLRRRLTGVILFALVAGASVAAVLQYGFGSLHGTYWLTALGLSLGMAALSIPFLALESLFGMAGLGAGAALMMLLGNPLSGMAGPYWLPSGWATLGQLLPPGASGSLVRANAFFDGTGAGAPALVLAAWVLAGLLVILAADRRTASGAPAPAVSDRARGRFTAPLGTASAFYRRPARAAAPPTAMATLASRA
ncbi:hypothetical protein ACIBH1_26810 [Nonomuraea sp. NPDC050663]|uniref:hypothetical protein n=1 Tax=Nonomuraea sp. NPDC050663 TaxID=3364370 RepID=UPI00378D8B23